MYNTPYCEVTHLKAQSAVFCKWKRFCRGEDYRAPFRYAHALIEEHNLTTWITDTRQGFENDEADTIWLLETFVPLMKKSSIEKVVFIVEEDSLLYEEIAAQAKALETFFEVEMVAQYAKESKQ